MVDQRKELSAKLAAIQQASEEPRARDESADAETLHEGP